MQANPDKFQAISVGRKTKDSNIDFNIDNFTIQCDEEVILLGVTIDFRLILGLQSLVGVAFEPLVRVIRTFYLY